MSDLENEFTAPSITKKKSTSRREAWLNFLLPVITFILLLILWEYLV